MPDKPSCILKHGTVAIGHDILHTPPDKWKPNITNIDGGETHRGDGTSALNVTQNFHNVEIAVKQNLLDAIIQSVQQVIDAVTDIPESGGIGALQKIKEAIQTLVFDIDRSLVVNWDYSFSVAPKDRLHRLRLRHNDVIRSSLYVSNRSNLKKMEWEVDTKVEFDGDRPKLRTQAKSDKIGTAVHILNGKGEPDHMTTRGGDKSISLYSTLSLRSTGFGAALDEIIQKLLKAIGDAVDAWAKVKELVKDAIDEWIKENTETVSEYFGLSSREVPPDKDAIEAQRKAETEKRQQDIIRKAKAVLRSLLDVIQKLIAEWQGHVELFRSELTIECVGADEEETAVPPEEGEETEEENSEKPGAKQPTEEKREVEERGKKRAK